MSLLRVVFIFFLGSLLNSCVTGDPGAPSEKSILAHELAIVKNSLDQGNSNKAWAQVRPLLRRYPKNPDVLNMGGLVHLALDNQERALATLELGYRLSPRPAAGLNLSSAYLAQGKNRKARSFLYKIVRKYPEYEFRERMYHNIGLSFEQEKRYAKAKRFYVKALKENPNFLMSLLRIAKLHGKRGGKYYLRARKLCPACYEPVAFLARTYLREGKQAKAKSLLKKYMQEEWLHKEDRLKAKRLYSLAKQPKNLR